jgi:hypothetical protein
MTLFEESRTDPVYGAIGPLSGVALPEAFASVGGYLSQGAAVGAIWGTVYALIDTEMIEDAVHELMAELQKSLESEITKDAVTRNIEVKGR